MSEIRFSDGLPERATIAGTDKNPEELVGKVCAGCVRCEKRDRPGETGWHCSMQAYWRNISPEATACESYWDKAEQDELDRLRNEDEEKHREELWDVYSKREPVKLPIVNDGYGWIPKCPVCGEMPYSTTQCHWCGQRFLQDREVEEYSKPETEYMSCPMCGGKMMVNVSRYNGHRRGRCEECGMRFME